MSPHRQAADTSACCTRTNLQDPTLREEVWKSAAHGVTRKLQTVRRQCEAVPRSIRNPPLLTGYSPLRGNLNAVKNSRDPALRNSRPVWHVDDCLLHANEHHHRQKAAAKGQYIHGGRCMICRMHGRPAQDSCGRAHEAASSAMNVTPAS